MKWLVMQIVYGDEEGKKTEKIYENLKQYILYDNVRSGWFDSRKYKLVCFLIRASQRERFPLSVDLIRMLGTYVTLF